jgi:hypothetical protein
MKVRYLGKESVQGRPFLLLEVDGRKARVAIEQPLARLGIVYLGDEFEEDYSAVIPADPEDGRPAAQRMAGATDDEALLDLFIAFWEEVNDADFDEATAAA